MLYRSSTILLLRPKSSVWFGRVPIILCRRDSKRRRACAYYHALTFREHGDPLVVLQYDHDDNQPLVDEQSHQRRTTTTGTTVVEFLAAPWNPADAMVVAGTYPSALLLSKQQSDSDPSASIGLLLANNNNNGRSMIAGSEGWGRVVQTNASSLSYLAVGDYVVPGRPGLGTMRSHYYYYYGTAEEQEEEEQLFIKLDRGAELYDKFGPFAPAPLFQTGGTAWRLLHDFVDKHNNSNKDHHDYNPIRPGETILQNAGNSAVGYLVSQMASYLGGRPVSLVRRGRRNPAQNDQLAHELMTIGKNELVEEDLVDSTTTLAKILADQGLDPPRLAINAVGGRSAQQLLSVLAAGGGTLVTYGGMSKQPISVATYPLIFHDVRLVGYWQSRWMTHGSTHEQRRHLMNQLVDLVLDGHISLPPTKVFRLDSYADALRWDQSDETIRRKVVFDCREREEQQEPPPP
jgi:mitochondrial enoyl-[acyl-carrier protein] reductase / trans-2-enoyl-CoA reductase